MGISYQRAKEQICIYCKKSIDKTLIIHHGRRRIKGEVSQI